MKLKYITILLIAALVALTAGLNQPEKAKPTKNTSITSINLTDIIASMGESRRNKRLDKIKRAVLVYNPEVTDETANDLLVAIEEYNLDESLEMFSYSIYQILLESRGRQYDDKGNILTSSANALGITQIKSSTAFHYLSMEMSQKDRDRLVELGADPIKFGPKDKVYRAESDEGKTFWTTPDKTKKKVAKWLENSTNGIMLWGYIMRHNIDKHGFYNALVIYSAGKGGWQHYKSNHSSIYGHSYLKGIRKVQLHLKTKEATV